jgi:hypothetical protein
MQLLILLAYPPTQTDSTPRPCPMLVARCDDEFWPHESMEMPLQAYADRAAQSARGLERELLAGDQVSPGRFDPKTPRCLANPQILGSRRLQPLGAAHLPPLQNNMGRAGHALLGLGQWEGEKEGRSVGGARRMNAAAQTAGQLADDR